MDNKLSGRNTHMTETHRKFKRLNGKKALTILSLSVLLAVSPVQNVIAQITPAPSPCDPLYYESMEQRAWLEAQREITQNQNLITKPDSVLAYTCFEGHLLELGDHADEMFSETTRWGNNVLGAGQDMHMNRALEVLVQNALRTYLDSNFISAGIRNQLGGRASTNRNNLIGAVPNGGNYNCSIMQNVWMEAKCYDFNNGPYDGFFTFEDYANGNVRRIYPDPGNPCVEPTGMFTAAMDTAYRNPPWGLDQTQTYLERMDAAECGNFPPIATGVIVTRPQQTPRRYFEGVCLQPGCHYSPTPGPAAGNPPPLSPGRCIP